MFYSSINLNKKISQCYNLIKMVLNLFYSRGNCFTWNCFTFIIDEDFIVRYMSINDIFLGRNIDEFLRIIDAIDHYKEHGEVCPSGCLRFRNYD